MSMRLSTFEALNRERCEDPEGFSHQLASWSRNDWLAAIVGECGEYSRAVHRIHQHASSAARLPVVFELADVITYISLMFQSLGTSILGEMGEAYEQGCGTLTFKAIVPDAAGGIFDVTSQSSSAALMQYVADACEASKKLRRSEGGFTGNLYDRSPPPYWERFFDAMKSAFVLCGACIAHSGFAVDDILMRKFNEVSQRCGYRGYQGEM